MLCDVHKLYVVHSSHPSEAVKAALALKGMPYKTVEMLVPTQAVITRLKFPERSVPALRLDSGEKVQGSVAIMHRLDELVPDPPLLPADEAARAAVLGAELWGADVLQPLARRVFWGAAKRSPRSISSYQAASQLPRLPKPILRVVFPPVARLEIAMHGADDDALRADLRALPGHVDMVDSWIAEGVIGGEQPNAADLQIGSSLRFLHTLGDVRPLLAGRPAEELALRNFPVYPGEIPAGAYPSGWVPARA
jgi:glutathione S-transferase